jgi:serine protease Do
MVVKMMKQSLLFSLTLLLSLPAIAETKGIFASIWGDSKNDSTSHSDKVIPPSKAQVNFSLAPVIKKVSPAVVSISAVQMVNNQRNLLFDDPLFRFFFEGGVPRAQVERSLGSGVIIDPQGVIVTCAHVVQNSEAIQVRLADNREYTATVSYLDRRNDLAIIKINEIAKNVELPYVKLGDSKNLEVGDFVFAIGNPFGVGQTVTNGIVSALARNIGNRILIQTDASINPGNSGGGLFDIHGNLIAIPNAILSKTGASHGIGFAIPSSVVRPLLDGIKNNNKIVRPWAGISVSHVTMELASALGLFKPEGVIVQQIHPLSPALAVGLKQGDIIVKVSGREVYSPEDFQVVLQESSVDDRIYLEIKRDGKISTLNFLLIAPPAQPAPNITTLTGNTPFAGMKIANLSPALAIEHNFDNDMATGVVVLEPSKNLLAFHLIPGDIFESVNGKEVSDVTMLKNMLEDKSHGLKLIVRRGDQKLVIAIQ